jgi:hypothetical protein
VLLLPRDTQLPAIVADNPISKEAEMANKLETLFCTGCGEDVEATPRTSFLGFPTFTCPRCQSRVWHPMSKARRMVCWLILGMVVAACVHVVINGNIPLPGLVGVLAAVALGVDRSLAARIHARRVARERARASLAG